MNYEAVIGLEVHAHLATSSKAFCGCSTQFGALPNTHTCPVCLGFPGSLPVLNELALEYALKTALALNCQIQNFLKFDRKNYFYPDLPKNYQISQYDMPLSLNGFLDIELEANLKRIGIKRVHLEEDAGKLIHEKDASFLDYNRAGIPLLEIVSEPDINSPLEAYEYLLSLKSILKYLGVSDCDMEKGSLRCDANISMRQEGQKGLGVKTELKNMNSFKAVKAALEFEIQRQTELLKDGKKIIQETLLWDDEAGQTISMRTKEGASDYRYFPEPDLPPFIIESEKIEEMKRTIPELPRQKILRLIKEYGVSRYDAKIIVFSSREYAEITEERLRKYPGEDKKPIVNWSTGPLLSEANNLNCSPDKLKIPGGNSELIALVKAVEEGKISNLMAKSVFTESIASGKPSSLIISEKNLLQVSTDLELLPYIEEVIKGNPKSVQDYKSGKENALMFLVGQVMRKTHGKANPKVVGTLLKRRLEEENNV